MLDWLVDLKDVFPEGCRASYPNATTFRLESTIISSLFLRKIVHGKVTRRRWLDYWFIFANAVIPPHYRDLAKDIVDALIDSEYLLRTQTRHRGYQSPIHRLMSFRRPLATPSPDTTKLILGSLVKTPPWNGLASNVTEPIEVNSPMSSIIVSLKCANFLKIENFLCDLAGMQTVVAQGYPDRGLNLP